MIRRWLSGKSWLGGITAGAVTLVMAVPGVAANVSAAENAYLTFAGDDFEVELKATAWGRVERLREGEHVKGLPKKGTKTLSIFGDDTTFRVMVGNGSSHPIFGEPSESHQPPADGGWLDLTLYDSPGDDRVYRFTEVSGLACNERSRVCSFDFGKVEYSGQ